MLVRIHEPESRSGPTHEQCANDACSISRRESYRRSVAAGAAVSPARSMIG